MNPAGAVTSASTVVHALPEFSAQTRLLVVAPHPDDETIATGILIQRVRAAGGVVRVLLLTAGDNNPWPQRWLERRLHIGVTERQRWGVRRRGEMVQALGLLGLPASSLQSLGWPDLGLNDRVLLALGPSLATLAAAIADFRPSLLLAPALSDHHPDHGAAHVLLRLALAAQPLPPPMLTYLVHGDPARGQVFEIAGSAAQFATKLAALEAHRSQMSLSGKRMRRLASRPERCAGLAPRQLALPWQPAAWLQPWLRLSVVTASGATSWRWREAPLRRDEAGAWHLLPKAPPRQRPVFVRLALSLPTPWIFDRWGWAELS